MRLRAPQEVPSICATYEVVNHNQHVQCDREGDVGLCYAVELDYSQQEWTGKTMECGSRKLTTRSLVRTTVQATEIGD